MGIHKILKTLRAFTLIGLVATTAFAGSVPITVLHTNDLHSHFRPEKDEIGLGGVARLKTLIDTLRTPTTLLVDGGDWSEGHIYYNLGAGVESLRMLEILGYDAAVVGNHDFINGLEQLYRIQAEVKPQLKLLAANVDVKSDPKFSNIFPPFFLKNVGGVRVAMIGLTTYEFFYDQYLKPVVILSPFNVAKEISKFLKEKNLADVVFAISHNTIAVNKHVLEVATDLDFIVGAHDHRLLTAPIVVNATGRKKPGIIVEAGRWGHYLGKVDFNYIQETHSLEFSHYEVIPVSPEIVEDQSINDHITNLEKLLELRDGPIFSDHIADNEVHLSRDTNPESLIGNLVVDSYLGVTDADLAIDHVNLIYGHLHPGPLNSADIFNANPGIYSPETGKAWTIQRMEFKGSTLNWLFNFLCNFVEKAPKALPALSGMQILYDTDYTQTDDSKIKTPINPIYEFSSAMPQLFSPQTLLAPYAGTPLKTIIKEIRINGAKIDPGKTYVAAVGGGAAEAVNFINSFFPGAIPIISRRDTGIESWRALASKIKQISPVQLHKLEYGTRMKSVQPDLALLYDEISWSQVELNQGKVKAKLKVKIHNVGESGYINSAVAVNIKATTTDKRFDLANDSDWKPVSPLISLEPLNPNEQFEVEFPVEAFAQPGTLSHLVAIKIEVAQAPTEINLHNNKIVRLFDLRGLR